MTAKKTTKILLVNENKTAVDGLEKIIHKNDYSIITVRSGNKALSAINDHEFSLIIMNLKTPEMGGLEIIDQLKNNQQTGNIPIILIVDKTGENQCRRMGCESGPVDYLVTPFDPDLLKNKIDIFLTLKQTQDELKQTRTNLKLEVKRRKYIEEEIMFREKLEGVIEMAVSVCHELTQPLQIIAGYSDLILMNTNDPQNLHQRIHKIKEQVGRVTALTQQLMGITRYKTQAYLGKTKSVDLDLVNERRKHKRFIPRSGTILIPHFDETKQGQVIDISRDGLAFWGDDMDFIIPDDITQVSLSIPEIDIILKNLPCRFLDSNTRSNVMVLKNNRIKRHSLRFEPLTSYKLNKLEHFILNHTSAKTD